MLPDWFTQYLPPEDPLAGTWVKHDGETYFITTPLIEKWEDKSFDNLYDAFKYARTYRGHEVYVHLSCPEMDMPPYLAVDYIRIQEDFEPTKLKQLLPGMEVDTPVYFKMTVLDSAGYYFNSAKECEELFVNDPSFDTAYFYVTKHPAFWVRDRQDKYSTAHDWDKDSSQAIWSCPMWQGNGTYKWALEHGVHNDRDDHASRYRDFRFDVYGDTIEEAYIFMAHEVFKHFNFDGTEKVVDE